MDKEVAITYLKSMMSGNKAIGLVAQADFRRWVDQCGGNVSSKYFDGCWVISPKGSTASKRNCFFVHQRIENTQSFEDVIESQQANRGFHSLCGALTRSGLGVFYCIPLGDPNTKQLDYIDWILFSYQNECLVPIDAKRFFALWPGHGRSGSGKPWNEEVTKRYNEMQAEQLEALVLNQVFYNSFLKKKMQITAADPYDVDGFFVSYEGKVFPIELKEKFPFEVNKVRLLGIDVGRMLMLFRICLPLDSNGLYIVKEVDESKERLFIAWKMMTLDSMIMNCNLNLQAGGVGMTGGATQTATFPYVAFQNLTADTVSDDNLHQISAFSESIKQKALVFQKEVEKFILSANLKNIENQQKLFS